MKEFTHFTITVDVMNGKSYKSQQMPLDENVIDKEFMYTLTENPNLLKKLIINSEIDGSTIIFNNIILNNSVITLHFIKNEVATKKPRKNAKKSD